MACFRRNNNKIYIAFLLFNIVSVLYVRSKISEPESVLKIKNECRPKELETKEQKLNALEQNVIISNMEQNNNNNNKDNIGSVTLATASSKSFTENKEQSQNSQPIKAPNRHTEKHVGSSVLQSTTYTDALKEVVSPDGIVLLALVDEGFVDMTINFYLTCLKPHNIENYLILTMHESTCKNLAGYPIKCVQYTSNVAGNAKASNFGSQQFISKMNIRTDMIIDALKLNISVLHSDIDVTYYKNPFDYLNCPRSHCHLAPLKDNKALNAGFLLVHPQALPVYEHMRQLAKDNPKMNDQEQLNKAVKTQKEKDEHFRLNVLPIQQFQCGKHFYQNKNKKRYFADTMTPCPECVVVHNNWIVTMAAKVYRAKEVHQWMNDEKQYYTSTTRKYITYDNSPEANQTKPQQLETLKMAIIISKILNRTLILPKFYCESNQECALNSLLKVELFDRAFGPQYREHSFMTHPLVPQSVKKSIYHAATDNKVIRMKDIMKLYSSITDSVLKLEPMYDRIEFTTKTESRNYMGRVQAGFKRSDYMQAN